ncbi:MAG: TraX family protein [Clostridia bacterium]|nr:TraX family protein [Clostridia bacterium]
MSSLKMLSGNTLKIIAMVAMLVDHIGLILFPKVQILRIIGRIALPVFAFMVAEGCIHTKNKLKYFLTIFLLAVICQLGYFVAGFGLDLSILVTFSYSLLIIYSLQNLCKKLLDGRKGEIIFSSLLFVFVVGMTYIINRYYRADYGFWGCMLPVFAYIPVFVNQKASHIEKMLSFSAGLVILSLKLGGIQMYSLLALPLLMLYSGERGRYRIKYLFYAFYPLHLIVLYFIGYIAGK